MEKQQQDSQTPLDKISKRAPRKILSEALLVCASLLIAYGSWQLLKQHNATTAPATLPDVNKVITIDTDEPQESPPKEEEYTVPADQPRSISLPSISTKGLIQKVGLTEERAIAVPTNVYFGGWYVGSVAPGDIGLSIIDGHVSGRYSDGIFINLERVSVGDIVEVEYGDSSIRKFEIVDKQTLPEKESSAFLFQKRTDIEKQLNLITCGGTFDTSNNTFDKRVVVVAKAID